MRLKIFLILILCAMLLMSGTLFSRVSSRVQGKIVDEESGEPISGALVRLFHCHSSDNFLSYLPSSPADDIHENGIITGADGQFKFDHQISGEYFITVIKEGYAAFGPFPYKMPRAFEDRNSTKKINQVKRFYLKEGQIKHFVIKMEKEAILKVNVLRKTFEGTTPVEYFQIELQHPDYVENVKGSIWPGSENHPKAKEAIDLIGRQYIVTNEGFQTYCFKQGTVNLNIFTEGYPERQVDGIKLDKGQEKLIEWTLDFTKPPVVYGIFKNKNNGIPLDRALVGIQDHDDSDVTFYIDTHTDINGQFWLGGMSPGKYLLQMSYYDVEIDRDYYFKMVVDISADSFIKINKEL